MSTPILTDEACDAWADVLLDLIENTADEPKSATTKRRVPMSNNGYWAKHFAECERWVNRRGALEAADLLADELDRKEGNHHWKCLATSARRKFASKPSEAWDELRKIAGRADHHDIMVEV